MIRYMLALLMLFGLPVSASWGEDCLKLVANKYCLGGSFSKARDTAKDKDHFLAGDHKEICPDCIYFGFVDDNALGLENPLIIIDGRKDKIFSVRVCPNPKLKEQDYNKYLSHIKHLTEKLIDKYGKPIHFSKDKKAKYGWDEGSYFVNIALTPIGLCVAYTDRTFIVENKDILLNPEGF